MGPIWKWVIGIAVFLFVGIAGGAWYLSRHWMPILDKQVRAAVAHSSDSLYRIAYDALDLNLLTGNILLSNFELIPDTAVYQQLKLARKAPDNIYHIRVDQLRIRRFHPRRVLMGRRLHIDEIIFDQPAVHIRNEYQAYNDTVPAGDRKALYESIAQVLHSVSVGDILLNDIDFKFTKVTDTLVQDTELKNINLHVRDVLVDSLSQHDSTRFYYTRGIELAMPGIRYDTPDSLYYLGFDRLQVVASGASNELVLTGFTYAPRVSRTAFYQAVGYAKAIIDLKLDTLRFRGMDMQRFLNSQRLHADALYVQGGELAISNDIRYGRLQAKQIGDGPHQKLMRLGPNFRIDSVLLDAVDIRYSEIGERTGKEGEITFDRTNGKFYNVSNDSLYLLGNREMAWEVTTYLMNTGRLSASFAFDMLAADGAYSYNGRLGRMDGRVLNKLLHPLLNIEIASANIQGLHFDVHATDTRARGSLRFDYTDLKANILGEEDEEGRQVRKGLVSFLANRFIFNDSNPDANGVYHAGPINFSRPSDHTFWRYTWKSLLDGIKPSVGLDAEREERLQQRAASAKQAAERTGSFFRSLFQRKEEGDGND